MWTVSKLIQSYLSQNLLLALIAALIATAMVLLDIKMCLIVSFGLTLTMVSDSYVCTCKIGQIRRHHFVFQKVLIRADLPGPVQCPFERSGSKNSLSL